LLNIYKSSSFVSRKDLFLLEEKKKGGGEFTSSHHYGHTNFQGRNISLYFNSITMQKKPCRSHLTLLQVKRACSWLTAPVWLQLISAGSPNLLPAIMTSSSEIWIRSTPSTLVQGKSSLSLLFSMEYLCRRINQWCERKHKILSSKICRWHKR